MSASRPRDPTPPAPRAVHGGAPHGGTAAARHATTPADAARTGPATHTQRARRTAAKPPHPADDGLQAAADQSGPIASRAQALDWARDAATWPHADKSRFVSAGGWRWHLQVHGPGAADLVAADQPAHGPAVRPSGARSHPHRRHEAEGVAGRVGHPLMLLLHGTGASAHSWRTFAPLLAAAGHTVLVPDLPGHGFTRAEGRELLTLPAMAQALTALLAALGGEVRWVVGHSAGAAVAAHLALEGAIAPRALLAFNGALLPLQGPAGTLFSPMARWLALNPLVPSLFAWYASQPSVLRRLVDGTGSVLDDEGRALYGRLVRDPAHVAGALAMMASWDLRPLQRALPKLATPLELLVGGGDKTLPPTHAERVRTLVPRARITRLGKLGHLMHEEAAGTVWERLRSLQPGLASASD